MEAEQDPSAAEEEDKVRTRGGDEGIGEEMAREVWRNMRGGWKAVEEA